MKNLAFALLTSLLLAACSSGSTSSDLPQNASGTFTGTFQNVDNSQSGSITINLSQSNSETEVVGNIVLNDITSDPGINAACIQSGIIAGTANGFNVTLTSTTGGASGGTINFQLSLNGNSLNGTYVSEIMGCSSGTGSGSLTLNRS